MGAGRFVREQDASDKIGYGEAEKAGALQLVAGGKD
jgi:hypothetical protein